MSEISVKTEKLTRKFCEGRILIFEPKTQKEACMIQLALFDMGFSWKYGEAKVQELEECVNQKMFLADRYLFLRPNAEHLRNGICCTVSPLGILETPEQKMSNAFNDLSARMGVLEEKMDMILEALKPQGRLDKARPGNSL